MVASISDLKRHSKPSKSKTDPGYSLSRLGCTVQAGRWHDTIVHEALSSRVQDMQHRLDCCDSLHGSSVGGVTSGLVTPDTPLVLPLPKSDYILPSWFGLAWLPQFALLASMWALLQPHFLAVRPGKIVLLRCTQPGQPKIIAQPLACKAAGNDIKSALNSGVGALRF